MTTRTPDAPYDVVGDAGVTQLPWSGSRRSRALAWSLLALNVVGSIALVLLEFGHHDPSAVGDIAGAVLSVLVFAGLGTLLALRQPANPIGWLLIAGGSVWFLNGVAGDQVKYALQGGAEVTYSLGLLADFDAWIWPLGLLCSLGLPLLLFPTGRIRSRRWGWVLWLMVAGAVLTIVAGALSAGPIDTTNDDGRSLANPWGIQQISTVTAVVENLAPALMLAAMAAAVVGNVGRFRSVTGVERQQLRWVITGASVAIASILVFPIDGWVGLPGYVVDFTFTVGLSCLPLSFTMAILRYRLYDLDRVVSRTVTYGALTGLLVASYAGLVTAVSRLTPSSSSLAVASSTLAVAALFQPLRRWLQGAVDRRFNRARYDAARTVEEFSLRLRDEVDLEAVRTDLVGVVRQTMQPDTVLLWLRDASRVTP